MSLVDTTETQPLDRVDPSSSPPRARESMVSSPFGTGSLFAESMAAEPVPAFLESLVTPFGESMAALDDHELEQEAVATLVAEFDDEEFSEALEALTNEAAARHLRGMDAWSSETAAVELAATDVEQWLEQLAGAVEGRLRELETQFGDRTIESLSEAEVESIAPDTSAGWSPLDTQELFFKAIFKKVKKAARGVKKLIKKGVRAMKKLFPIGKLFGFIRKLVRPLLRRVLNRAIGKLPGPLQPAARRLAKRFGAEAEADSTGDGFEAQALAEQFDELLAEAILSPNEAESERLMEDEAAAEGAAGEHTLPDLDAARRRLAEQLAEAETGVPPIEQMEQFVPVVMAAMPLLRLGVRAIGRRRIVNSIAKLIASLIQGMVGRGPAQALSRHIASTGLGLLGLEAEADRGGVVGAEALVAAAEDTVHDVMAMAPEALENELLLEAAVQEAFTEAAVRHLPAEVLRSDLVEAGGEAEHGVWLMMPRGGPAYRYKKYSRVLPVTITRPLAARVVLAEGDTLQERLLDAGVSRFPVEGEMHLYEAITGTELGHIAAYERDDVAESVADATTEFEELTATSPLPIALPGARAVPRRPTAAPGGRPQPGTRWYRLRVRGVRLRRRPRFAVRLDLTAPTPQARIHLPVAERDAHTIARQLQRRRHVQVVAAFRRILGPPLRTAMGARLERMLTRRALSVPTGAGAQLANRLADGALKAIADRLPAAAAELERAAKDPAPGLTVTVAFAFSSREAIVAGEAVNQMVTIRPGLHRD